ncbi:hypothetical protein DB41_HP00020 [Neochlamydia sp. TUME1]|uniref:hypothetical protein n=1 Tax=Neochlamydia sp. TUME1 TaxID=1478174 RepID=UPI00057D6363|nr:hypothetical protein [Neochlamydia sp. TUME1]KIC75348.1 hypothetical protein DB41_HP00020 [Neochlamydia sp. TUME1]
MNKTYFLFFFILMFTLSSCMLSVLDSYEEPEQAVFVSDILNKTSKKLQKKYSMRTIGTGIGMPDGVVTMLALSFEKTGPLSREEGRRIIVDCVQEMLQIINTHERIRPHLKNYPFTPSDIEIAIFLKDPLGYNIFYPHFGALSSTNAQIDYMFTASENPKRYLKIEEEKFEEALEMVQNESKK